HPQPVGTGLVPTVTNVFKFDETQAPSDEGAVERSETEGEKAINIKLLLSLPQSFFFEKRQLPLQGSLCRTTARVVPTVAQIRLCNLA
ncbi:MAG: hypothetical protein MR823_07470, partial [Ruminococcus sp.]|nr:hypothetical protein [Ruminococcus sp.]